jgi:two-component system cell cycle sensor histidine kinase/response regulator CckA
MTQILIIDDEKSIRVTLRELLSIEGYQVYTAESADEAYKYVDKYDFDVIITDVILPKIDGISLIKSIAKSQPNAKFIIISGEPNLSSASAAIRMGAFDYLAKPISPRTIQRSVANAVHVKQLSDEKKRLEVENLQYREHLEKLVKKRTQRLLKANAELQREIHQRINTEKKLNISREQLSIVINNLPALIAYIDADEKYLFFNRAYADYYHIQSQGESPLSLSDLLSDAEYAQEKPRIVQVLAGKNVQFEDEKQNPNGEKHIFQTQYIPHWDQDGKVRTFFLVSQDITEYHYMKKEAFQAQRLESLTNLASGIANEYNNMLTVLLGNITLTKIGDRTSPDIKNRLDQMEEAVYNAKELTRQIYAFSQKEAVPKEFYLLSDLIKKSIAISPESSDIQFRLKFPETDCQVDVEVSNIIHVITELIKTLINAKPDDRKIRIAVKHVYHSWSNFVPLQNGDYAVVSISAKTELVPLTQVNQIFDPFSEAGNLHNSMKMAAINSTIRKHNGFLTVNIHKKTGTTFTIYLPVQPSSTPMVHDQPLQKIRGGRVLVMDDEDPVGYIISQMLQYLGYKVTVLKDGKDVIQKYKAAMCSKHPYDIVILDLFVPEGMGAMVTIKELVQIDPKVKAIIMSGYCNDPVLDNYSDYGFVGRLNKPIEIESLKNIVTNIT